jgi:peptide/nickel transport system substrate-binding protein
MSKWLAIPLVLIIAFSVLISSCGTKETTTTKATTTTTAAATTTAVKPTATTTGPTATTVPATTAAREAPYGTIKYATTTFGVESFDPIVWATTWNILIYDTILDYTKEGKYVGKVAESWTLSPDGKTWTFKIRKGIKFHNGDPLTANDVYFEMARMVSPDSKSAWSTNPRDQFVSHRVIDDYTYEFVTKDPQPQLVDSFANIEVLPKNYIQTVGMTEFAKHPIGSGHWKFVSWTPQTKLVVEANTDYWNKDEIPYFKNWEEYLVPEEATQVAMLKRGDIDIPTGLTTDRIVELRDAGWQTRVQGLPTPQILAILGSNLPESGPVSDIRVRQALSYAINRQEMCDTLWRKTATPGGGFFMVPGVYGAADDLLAPDPYDPAKAKSLLADAGYPGKWANPTINVCTIAGPSMDFWLALQGYWQKVGLQVKVNVIDVSVWYQILFVGPNVKSNYQYLGWIWSFSLASFNGTAYDRNMYTSYGIHSVTAYKDVDALFDKYIVELDPAKAVTEYDDWLRAAKAKFTSIGVAMVNPILIVSNNIGNFTLYPHKFLQFAAAGIQHPKK